MSLIREESLKAMGGEVNDTALAGLGSICTDKLSGFDLNGFHLTRAATAKLAGLTCFNRLCA